MPMFVWSYRKIDWRIRDARPKAGVGSGAIVGVNGDLIVEPLREAGRALGSNFANGSYSTWLAVLEYLVSSGIRPKYRTDNRCNDYFTTFNRGTTGLSNKSIVCLNRSFFTNAAYAFSVVLTEA